VASIAAAGAEARPPQRQGHIVVDNHQVFGPGSEPGQQVCDSFTTVVHEGTGLGQHDLLANVISTAKDYLGAAV
jgi:hypothetical protein